MSVILKGSDQAEFMFSFGQFIVVWNHVELVARDILSWLAGGNVTAHILAYQAGNTSLTDAVRLSSEWRPEGQEHLVHFANMMDTVRAYRNFYVHNLIGVAPHTETREPIGIVMTLNVKGKYVIHEKALKISDLDEMAENADNARKYGLAILEIFKAHDAIPARVEPFASLEKPALPKTLTKTVRGPTETEPPPQS